MCAKSDPKTDRLYEEMCQARKEWEAASESFKESTELFRDLEGNVDGIAALRQACNREIEALKRYRAAVEAYAKAVKAG